MARIGEGRTDGAQAAVFAQGYERVSGAKVRFRMTPVVSRSHAFLGKLNSRYCFQWNCFAGFPEGFYQGLLRACLVQGCMGFRAM